MKIIPYRHQFFQALFSSTAQVLLVTAKIAFIFMRNSVLVTHGSLRVKESLRKVLPKKSFAPESDDNVIKIYTGINLKAP